MNIGIVTLYGNDNFGNKLQNYALQEYIKRLDSRYSVDTIISYNDTFKEVIKNFLSKKNSNTRLANFLEFNKYINYTTEKVGVNHPKLKKKYDFLVFGSDQVWNCDFEGKTNFFSGNFNDKIKKISYAASFGKTYVDKNHIDLYKKSLSKFKYISVREDVGKSIVEDLIHKKDIEVLVDPTMLLNSNEWDVISKKPSMLKDDKYILNYFLGELSIERKKEIERIATEQKCKVINILDRNSPYYECGPSEFLWLEKHAYLICTDSFHSSVFAILYNRPFIVFDREQKGIEKMNSRLDTLISKFKLKNRKFENKITEANLKHDYSQAYSILEEEKTKSEKFLKKALELKNEKE